MLKSNNVVNKFHFKGYKTFATLPGLDMHGNMYGESCTPTACLTPLSAKRSITTFISAGIIMGTGLPLFPLTVKIDWLSRSFASRGDSDWVNCAKWASSFGRFL